MRYQTRPHPVHKMSTRLERSPLVEVDLVELVLRDRFGPFHKRMSRGDIVQVLGPEDEGYYPEHVGYGNLCFDVGPPSAVQVTTVQVMFPHESHSTCPNAAWKATWSPPPWLENWPDPRLHWHLAPFRPGVTIPELQGQVSDLRALEPSEGVRYPGGRVQVLSAPHSGTDLYFESVREDDEPTLSVILGWVSRSSNSPVD